MKKRALKILALRPDTLEARSELDCPDCQVSLALHQPDLERPDRLLGICPECHLWMLVNAGESGRIQLTALLDPD